MPNNNIIVILDDSFKTTGWVFPADSFCNNIQTKPCGQEIFIASSRYKWTYDDITIDIVKKVREDLIKNGLSKFDCIWGVIGGTLPSASPLSRLEEEVKIFYLRDELDSTFAFVRRTVGMQGNSIVATRKEYESIFWKLFDARYGGGYQPIHE